METFKIPLEGTFLLQATLAVTSSTSLSDNFTGTSATPYSTDIADLSGYTYELSLTSKKQVLINSVTTEIKLNSQDNPANVLFAKNVINIVIPTDILSENTFYIGKIIMKNSQFSNVVYTFQLILDEFAQSIPMLKQASIVFDSLTYTLIIQNQF